jgi:hypothetical protein
MTLAQLKRDAKAGIISGELIERHGSTEIIERLQGIRPVVDSNSVCIKFQNMDGKISECRIDAASLMEYTGDELLIFNPGIRPLNDEEQKVMDAWNKIAGTGEFRERLECDALTDGSSTYWQEKYYFEKSSCPWLFGGTEVIKGKRVIYKDSKKMVVDNAVKGDVVLRYKIHRKSA